MDELYEWFDNGDFYYNTSSEALRGFRYNQEEEVLEVCFERDSEYDDWRTGEHRMTVYRYYDVPYEIYDSLLDEDKWQVVMYRRGLDIVERYSIGTAFNSLINYNKDYEYTSYSVPAEDIEFLDYYTGE